MRSTCIFEKSSKIIVHSVQVCQQPILWLTTSNLLVLYQICITLVPKKERKNCFTFFLRGKKRKCNMLFSGYTYLPPCLFILGCSNCFTENTLSLPWEILCFTIEHWIIWYYLITENLVEQQKEFDAVIASEVCSHCHSTCGNSFRYLSKFLYELVFKMQL